LKESFSRKDELVFLDFITDQKKTSNPMIPGGKGITEMILYEDCDTATSSRSLWRTRPGALSRIAGLFSARG